MGVAQASVEDSAAQQTVALHQGNALYKVYDSPQKTKHTASPSTLYERPPPPP